MSFRVLRCVLDHHGNKLLPSDLLVLIYLANHAHDDGAGAWPAQTTLADETNQNRRTVQRALDRLARMGTVKVEERPGRTHRFRVWLCLECESASESRTRTNLPASQSHRGVTQSPGG
jgi:DNA-binding MarR family transcriptional regulator